MNIVDKGKHAVIFKDDDIPEIKKMFLESDDFNDPEISSYYTLETKAKEVNLVTIKKHFTWDVIHSLSHYLVF